MIICLHLRNRLACKQERNRRPRGVPTRLRSGKERIQDQNDQGDALGCAKVGSRADHGWSTVRIVLLLCNFANLVLISNIGNWQLGSWTMPREKSWSSRSICGPVGSSCLYLFQRLYTMYDIFSLESTLLDIYVGFGTPDVSYFLVLLVSERNASMRSLAPALVQCANSASYGT